MEQQFYLEISQLDEIIQKSPINKKIAAETFNLLKTDIELENYFFNNINNIEWFAYLLDEKYFNPRTILFDREGNALFWNVLYYLERVSEQLDQNPSYGKVLIDIIETTINFSISKKRINNYHIWRYCVKILNNVPDKIIQEALGLEVFKKWLSVWTDWNKGRDIALKDIGEKLLPKFINDPATIEYAWSIIDVITRFKSESAQGSFEKREDAVFLWDPYWVRDAFRKNSNLIGENSSVNVILSIAHRLKSALAYKQKRHYSNIPIDQNAYRLEVRRVFTEGLEVGEIEFKENEYECIIKEFSRYQLKDINTQEDHSSFSLYYVEPQIELAHFNIKAFDENIFLKTINENLPHDIEWEKAKDFQKDLKNIYEGLHADYSHIWCWSLHQGLPHDEGVKEILTIALRDVLIAKCEANRIEGKLVLKEFLSERFLFPIFRRLVLYSINKYWSDYAPLFDIFLDVVPNAFEESDFEVELQDLLREHNASFDHSLKERLMILIKNVPEYYLKEGEKMIAFWKYKWLSPLFKNPYFAIDYEKAKKIAEPKEEKPYEVKSPIRGGVVFHKSPFAKEHILQLPIPELVKYLNDFKGADFWRGTFEGEPDRQGLADELQKAVKENPEHFTDGLESFLNANYFFVHQVYQGLERAWNEKKDIGWGRIFDFSLKYFGRDKNTLINEALQEQGEDSGEGRYIWVVEDVVDLIDSGCRDDNRAFDPIYFDKAEKIFDLIMPLLKGEQHPDTQSQRDALTYSMNTTLGKTVQGYISLRLRKARVLKKTEEGWGQKKYEPFFDIGIEAHVWFGFYLPQMKYLDEIFSKEKIETFAGQHPEDFKWRMFMEGYLQGRQVYPDLYSLMRENYVKGLECKLFEKRADQRLVEHIALGYLHFGESLAENNEDGSSSLFYKMLIEAASLDKKERWLKLVGFLGAVADRAIRRKENGEEDNFEELKKKILDFWAWTFSEQDFIKTILGDDCGIFLGQVAGLTNLLDSIDEKNEEWLLLCSPHVDRHDNAMSFIEKLTRFEDEESIRRIGKIFLKVMENTTPTFMEEQVGLIVSKIYEKGDKNDADAICNTYGRRGIHFLKPLWEKHQ
ncbi:MAG: hypothetical protein HY787_13220 [Deltaproteobacteria bacterium]|nr:hypothetical protein [Deltaproteobacteria bacterium]